MSPANFSIPLFRYSVEGVILFRTPRTGGARKKIEKREEIKGKKGIPTTGRFELNPSLRMVRIFRSGGKDHFGRKIRFIFLAGKVGGCGGK
jgi:hypothetical protein